MLSDTLFKVRTSTDAYELSAQAGYTTHGSASVLAFVTSPLCKAGTNCDSFSVEVRDANGVVVSTGTMASQNAVISKLSGTANVSGTLTASLESGKATFSSVQVDAAGSDVRLRARVTAPSAIGVDTSDVITGSDEITLTSSEYAGLNDGDEVLYARVDGGSVLAGLADNDTSVTTSGRRQSRRSSCLIHGRMRLTLLRRRV